MKDWVAFYLVTMESTTKPAGDVPFGDGRFDLIALVDHALTKGGRFEAKHEPLFGTFDTAYPNLGNQFTKGWSLLAGEDGLRSTFRDGDGQTVFTREPTHVETRRTAFVIRAEAHSAVAVLALHVAGTSSILDPLRTHLSTHFRQRDLKLTIRPAVPADLLNDYVTVREVRVVYPVSTPETSGSVFEGNDLAELGTIEVRYKAKRRQWFHWGAFRQLAAQGLIGIGALPEPDQVIAETILPDGRKRVVRVDSPQSGRAYRVLIDLTEQTAQGPDGAELTRKLAEELDSIFPSLDLA